MKLHILLFSLTIVLFSACSMKPLAPITFNKVNKELSYENDIKPILDRRCVTCHSCYNSACQLKLSSYEGLERGATKISVYENRLNAIEPTRLFIDAKNENEWREKGFFSVTEKLDTAEENNNESIMMRFLYQKMKNPKSIGKYSPETDELSCVKNRSELETYFNDNPHKGMPYGFPALEDKEYNLVQTWLSQGAKNSTHVEAISQKDSLQIQKFEAFFNQSDIKHQVMARYIYEHLFLAHISFGTPHAFYELVRSKTATNGVNVIATRFPFDEIEGKFYYRFKKIESTLVHKTHMVYELNEEKLKRLNELFITPNWDEIPHMPSYAHLSAANALKTFEQIPAKSRYQFLLDDIHFFIMTFIRGPVCKGQVALNVIQDQFWVMFLDPKYDVALYDKYFLHDNLINLSIPNEYGNNLGLFKMIDIYRGYEKTKEYYKNKDIIYQTYFPKGLPLESIWKGNKNSNDSILTVYRHFDSASVHKGAWGDIPKTLWVMDYSLVERLYYSLVAGFDIFGNTGHQLMVRKYMDRLRIEGESNFLEFLPRESRSQYFSSWYEDGDINYGDIFTKSHQESNIKYETNSYKKEFVEKLLAYTNTPKDKINFIEKGYKASPIKEKYNTIEEIEESFKALTLPNSSEIIQQFTGSKSNLAYIRIEMNSGENYVYSFIINRWHRNVAFMFDEASRLDPSKDRINFKRGFVGSYPNVFVVVKQDDLSEFFNIIQNYKENKANLKILNKFVINRANKNFWKVYDWFDSEFKKYDSKNYGLFDLNRYVDETVYEIDQ
ncbi:MAG: fatty acid cis/trans isomerase [Candidatus Marinarcus sp.]|uniref:fatty acid cis/trans isomerase n=1 Tax=Candidatus Marinarcus sp. TaxID=3100987 RepID=UPI003AFF61E6